jgi:hypothetical protein
MIIDLWFLFEIVINFFTAYYEKGCLVIDHKKIALNYAKTWFALDIISSFPISFMTHETLKYK